MTATYTAAVAVTVAEVKTCKDDYTCPSGFLNLGDKECRGKCDKRECCEKGECLEERQYLQTVVFGTDLPVTYFVN